MENDKNENVSYLINASDLAIQTNIEDLTCIICLNICFKPVIITCCERLICLECIKMMIKVSNIIKCPYCNEVNIKFEKPSKIINRLFENLTFYCPNKIKGCTENIKYFFYFDHIHNTCTLERSNFKFCKTCQTIYKQNHECYKEDTSKFSEIEKKLYELYAPSTKITSKIFVDRDKMNIPKLDQAYEQGWLCELCDDNIRNPSTKSYHCGICTFDICEKCSIFISSRVPNRTCHNHELNLEIRGLEWECDLCGDFYYMRRSWHCDLCQFDVCVRCYWK